MADPCKCSVQAHWTAVVDLPLRSPDSVGLLEGGFGVYALIQHLRMRRRTWTICFGCGAEWVTVELVSDQERRANVVEPRVR